jgi:hypothetical protein
MNQIAAGKPKMSKRQRAIFARCVLCDGGTKNVTGGVTLPAITCRAAGEYDGINVFCPQ